jgi:hypothetical protein
MTQQRFNGVFIPKDQLKGNTAMAMSNEEQQVREIFGPGSNSLKAAQMAKLDPQKYAQLKQAACYTYGIIAEAMLPRASQLTREQREQKARADAAAQKDDLIAIPDALADRVGVERGFRVTYENLQKIMGRVND